MTSGNSSPTLPQPSHGTSGDYWQARLDRLLWGLAQATDHHRFWLLSYASMALAAGLLLRLSRQVELGASKGGLTLATLVRYASAWSIGFLSVYVLLRVGKYLNNLAPRRVLGRAVVVAAAADAVLVSTVFLGAVGGTTAVAPVWAALLAFGVAAALMLVLLAVPGVTLDPDFAGLGMFYTWTSRLEKLSSLILFEIGGHQLLLWPSTLPAGSALSATQYLAWLVTASGTEPAVPVLVVNVACTLLLAVTVLLAVLGVYFDLAHRLWAPRLPQLLAACRRLLFSNPRNRWTKQGTPIWPEPADDRAPNRPDEPVDSALLEQFLFSSSFAAVTLTFALWLPRVLPYGAATFGRIAQIIAAGQWRVLASQSELLALLVLVLFLAGGVSTWIRTIEMAGRHGVFYTLGLWIGTLPLYWLSSLFVVAGGTAIVTLARARLSSAESYQFESAFVSWYRAILGALTIVAATSQAGRTRGSASLPRTLRYGLATVGVLAIAGFALNYLSAAYGATDIRRDIAPVLLFAMWLAIFHLSPRRSRGADLRPFGAQLIASSSLALAPLLFSSRVSTIDWSEEGYADIKVYVGATHEPARLRVHIMGSEEEVAHETDSSDYAKLRGEMDFVLTDLRTAIKIVASSRARKRRRGEEYRVMSVVCSIPWYRVRVSHTGQEMETSFTLDSGYLRYAPPYREPEDPGHPRAWHPDLCRVASLATVARYAARGGPDVGEALLADPYFSWVQCERRGRKRSPVEVMSSRLVTYVLLTRHRETNGPAVPYNWRRTMCEMIAEGQSAAQDNQWIVNQTHLHRLQAFLQRAVGSDIQLRLDHLQSAICSSHFERGFSSERSSDYALAVRELYRSRLVPHGKQPLCEQLSGRLMAGQADAASLMREALDLASPPIVEDGNESDDNFFTRFYPATSEAKTDPEIARYLHTLVSVAIPDRPGELATLLAQLRGEEACSEVDLALVATANLGEYAQVFLLNKRDLPLSIPPECAEAGTPLPRTSDSSRWVATMKKAGLNPIEVSALMVPLRHSAGALCDVVRRLSQSDSLAGLNIEQVFGFPLSDTLAVGLLVVRRQDWKRALSRLLGQAHDASAEPISHSMSRCADRVDLEVCPGVRRHRQQVVFKVGLRPFWSIRFSSATLPTWTPTWGGIDGWHAEVGFEEIRLKIPTALGYQIGAAELIGRIPVLGHRLRRALRGRLPGFAGLEAYKENANWRLEAEDGLDAPAG